MDTAASVDLALSWVREDSSRLVEMMGVPRPRSLCIYGCFIVFFILSISLIYMYCNFFRMFQIVFNVF